MRISALLWLCFTVLLLVAAPTYAQLIDFEHTPGGAVPTDDLELTSSYTIAGVTVQFGFDTNLDTVIDHNGWFERAGGSPGEPNPGFVGTNGIDTADTPTLALQLGQWFLRPQLSGSNFGKFVIQYSTALTITAASGEIWDIDGIEQQFPNPPITEKYHVEAFDSSNTLLDFADSPEGIDAETPLDGQPWTFIFSGLTAGIDHIEITFTGTKTSGIGLAFNNFYPTTVPEPVGTMIAIVGIIGVTRRRHRS